MTLTQQRLDEVIVALPHLETVLRAFDVARKWDDRPGDSRPLYTDPEGADRSTALGLARVAVTDMTGLATALEGWADSEGAGNVFNGFPKPGPDADPLDRVLWNLRAGFGAQYCNWTPTVGKNRVVGWVPGRQNPDGGDGGVGGVGEVSHGGGKPPRAVQSVPAWANALPVRRPTGVQVGVVDTRMVAHDSLSGFWVGPAEIRRPVHAEQGHATFIAGLLRRYAPGVTLQMRPVLDKDAAATVWDAALAIVEAGQAGIDVLNLSFVCYTADAHAPMVLTAALERLDPDTVVVAAAGNHGYLPGADRRKAAWPAASPDVIAVGALSDRNDGQPAGFSPDGPWIDVLAPGENLESTFMDDTVQVWEDPDGAGPAKPERRPERFNGYAVWSGTSFSSALVSAAIAERTVPGRVPARKAWEDLLDGARNTAAGHARQAPVPLTLPRD
ncbi:S8 family peptidase [Krasilnikovia sp. M28-CT-15]|uniref:S8 family peptidase n=1 Tax=Krasilnikovia sp. M28-CT-15 TaxID=3373540 RepID=UPI00399D2539